jgi:hypothetical protein
MAGLTGASRWRQRRAGALGVEGRPRSYSEPFILEAPGSGWLTSRRRGSENVDLGQYAAFGTGHGVLLHNGARQQKLAAVRFTSYQTTYHVARAPLSPPGDARPRLAGGTSRTDHQWRGGEKTKSGTHTTGVWISANSATVLRWSPQVSVRHRIVSTVPGHHRSTGRPPTEKHPAGEGHRDEHMRTFFEEVARTAGR